MNPIIQVGIIGFGNAGKYYHAPFLDSLPNFNLKTVVTTNESNIQFIKNNYCNTKIVSGAEIIFKDTDIELVVIATPNNTHYTLAKQALNSNKNVIVEKPFTVTCEEADELIEIAYKKGKILTVFHNRRFASDFKTVKKIIENNQMGEVFEYESHFDQYKPIILPNSWKESELSGAGMLYDIGSHLIDQVFCLFGLPLQLFADLRSQRKNTNSIDNFELILFYSHLKVVLKGNKLILKPRPQFAIYGDKGCFIKCGMDIQESDARLMRNPKSYSSWGIEPKESWGLLEINDTGITRQHIVQSERGDYSEFYNNVYEALQSAKEILVTPFEARNVIKAIQLAIESNREQKVINWL